MTIKPKAKKYRIRRSGSLAKPIDSASADDQSKVEDSGPTHPAFDETDETEDGFGSEHFSGVFGDVDLQVFSQTISDFDVARCCRWAAEFQRVGNNAA